MRSVDSGLLSAYLRKATAVGRSQFLCASPPILVLATNFGVGHQFWCLPAFLRPQSWCFAATTKFEVAEKLWTSILVTASPKLVTSFLYFEKKPNLVSLRSRDIAVEILLLLALRSCIIIMTEVRRHDGAVLKAGAILQTCITLYTGIELEIINTKEDS